MTQIIQNAVRIIKTGEILQSNHVHDYQSVTVDGRHIMIDGGREYFRSSNLSHNDVDNLCLTDDQPKKEIRNKLLWGTRGKTGKDPLKWVFIKDCEPDHLQAIIDNCPGIGKTHLDVVKYWLKVKTKTPRQKSAVPTRK